MSEEMIVRHCAPTLAGLKTGCIFRCAVESHEQLRQDIRRLNRRLTAKGLRILPLRIRNGYAMIYVYRPSRLRTDLSSNEADALLRSNGYEKLSPEQSERYIIRLMDRLSRSEEFPHEIGLFLGYPPEDVRGFIENGAKNEKHVGYWKVYGDEDKARAAFARFSKCTDVYTRKYAEGSSIERLTVAV